MATVPPKFEKLEALPKQGEEAELHRFFAQSLDLLPISTGTSCT